MNKYIPARLNAIKEYKAASYDGTVIRLDANESPFLPSEELAADFAVAIKEIAYNRYPDSSAEIAVEAFSRAYGVDTENIVAGNGSDELISVIINSFLSEGDGLLVCEPDFSMYEFYGELRGAKVERYEKSDSFEIDFTQLLDIIKSRNIKMVIFSNPCNPTGRAYGRDVLTDFTERAGTLVILDEAYNEFCEEDCSLLDVCGDMDNLIILKTVSKAFGLAALRCGFAVSNREIAAVIRKVKSPYNLNSVSQRLAAVALDHKDEAKVKASRIIAVRKQLYASLCALGGRYGFRIYTSDANFVLLGFNGDRAEEIMIGLADKGIKIRYLHPSYLRITAGEATETAVFLKEFESILSGEGKIQL